MGINSVKKKRGRPRKLAVVETRPSAGRPPFVPTQKQRDMVIGLTGLLVPVEVIARKVMNDGEGMDPETLRKYFSRELEIGREDTIAGLKGIMLAHAQRGSIRAAQFLIEKLGGAEFAPRLRVGGIEDAPPIKVSAEARITVYIPDNGRDKPPPAEATPEPEPADDPDDGE
jgi:hypothetical protein